MSKLDHSNLYLLMDSGHLQISRENPASVIAQAGDRLGYVHLDDNDGQDDLHWALCDGVLTRTRLRELLVALTNSPYMGPVGKTHPELKNPFESLRKVCRELREILGELP